MTLWSTDSYLPLSTPNGLGGTTVGYFLGTDTITFSFAHSDLRFRHIGQHFRPGFGRLRADDLRGHGGSGYDPFPGFSTGQFVGLTSDTGFSSVTLSAPGGFVYTVDDLNYAAVPEPSTLLLVGLGLAGLGLRRAKSLR